MSFKNTSEHFACVVHERKPPITIRKFDLIMDWSVSHNGSSTLILGFWEIVELLKAQF